MKKVVAVDFDGTLQKWDKYPAVGEEVPNAWNTVKRLIASSHHVIIWTVRDDHLPIRQILREQGFFNYKLITVNERPNQHEYSASPKVDADLYIDDKALGCPLVKEGGRTFVDWYAVEAMLEQQGYFDTIILGA